MPSLEARVQALEDDAGRVATAAEELLAMPAGLIYRIGTGDPEAMREGLDRFPVATAALRECTRRLFAPPSSELATN